MEKIILRIDSYSDVTKHTIGSVLAGIAIEANVIPYAELRAIGVFISKVSNPVWNNIARSLYACFIDYFAAYRIVLKPAV